MTIFNGARLSAAASTSRACLVDPANAEVTAASQLELLNIPRSSYCYKPRRRRRSLEGEGRELAMRAVEDVRLEMPYAGCRKVREELRRRAAGVCACVEEAFAAYGTPAIPNSDQGSVFNSAAYEGLLAGDGVRQSMDGKARWVDNVIVERRFRSLKTECVRIGEHGTPAELRRLISAYVDQYNNARPHQPLGYDIRGRAVLFGADGRLGGHVNGRGLTPGPGFRVQTNGPH